jgi:putative ABC transport system permease protein
MSLPAWLMRLWLRLRATLSGARDRDVRHELALHLQLLEEEYISRGLPPNVARARARREFGNAARFQETSHDLFAFRVVEDLAHDLRYAVREMRRRPAFTATVVASLAVGIGAATAAFAIVDALMLRGLTVREPDRLVAFASTEGRWTFWPHLALQRWQDVPDTPLDVAGASDVITQKPRAGQADSSKDVRITLVSTNYFQVMGAEMERGRAFAADDVRAPVAVISDEYWRRSLGVPGDASGLSVEIDGIRYPVVGVARRGFGGHAIAQPTDVWLPIAPATVALRGPGTLVGPRWATAAPWLHVVGRLHAGVTIEQATASAQLTRQRFVAEKIVELGVDSPEAARDRRQTFALVSAATGHAPERSRYARPLGIL